MIVLDPLPDVRIVLRFRAAPIFFKKLGIDQIKDQQDRKLRGNDISVFELLFYRCEHDLLIRPFFPLCVGGSQIYDRCPTRLRPVKCINELARRAA